MLLGVNLKEEVRAAKKIRFPWWVLLILLVITMSVAWIFDWMGRFELALPMLNGFLVLGLVIAIKQDLRKRAWFWVVIAVLATSQTWAIFQIPWNGTWVPAAAITLINTVYLVLVLILISAINRLRASKTR